MCLVLSSSFPLSSQPLVAVVIFSPPSVYGLPFPTGFPNATPLPSFPNACVRTRPPYSSSRPRPSSRRQCPPCLLRVRLWSEWGTGHGWPVGDAKEGRGRHYTPEPERGQRITAPRENGRRPFGGWETVGHDPSASPCISCHATAFFFSSSVAPPAIRFPVDPFAQCTLYRGLLFHSHEPPAPPIIPPYRAGPLSCFSASLVPTDF